MKKSAFTLAEVLITLTIIGVVMAMVIPVVRSSVTDTSGLQFKKSFTDFQNAVDMAIEDPESLSLGYDPTTQFVGATPENLCKMITNQFTTLGSINCAADSSNIASQNPSFQQINGVSYWNVGGTGTVSFKNGASNCTTASYSKACTRTIWIDIDSTQKGKNTHGKDRFRMLLRYDGKVLLGDPTSDNWSVEETAIKDSTF